MSTNEITGDEIKSRINTKEYEDNYDAIFRKEIEALQNMPDDTIDYSDIPELTEESLKNKFRQRTPLQIAEMEYHKLFKNKPQSLDAAYERHAMFQGLISNPIFKENIELLISPLDA